MQSLGGFEDVKPKRAVEPASGQSGAKKKRKKSGPAAARSSAAAANLFVRRSTRATAAPEFFDPHSADGDRRRQHRRESCIID